MTDDADVCLGVSSFAVINSNIGAGQISVIVLNTKKEELTAR